MTKSLAIQIQRLARVVNDRVLAALEESGYGIRRPYLELFQQLPVAGCTQVELAARMGISKQAVGKLVHEMAAMRLVEVSVHATDRRARWVRPSSVAVDGYQISHDRVSALEEEWRAALGAARAADLERLLDELLGLVRPPAAIQTTGS